MAQRPDRSSEIERHAAKLEKDPQSRIFAQLADAYRKEGLLDEAIRICRDGLAAHPTYVSGRVVLGRALLEQGALEEAEAEFRRVLELAPDNLLALRLLGDTSAQQGRSGEAREHYERTLRLNPLDRETQDRLAALPAHAADAPGAKPAAGSLEPEAPARLAMAGAGDEISLEDSLAAVSPGESQRGSEPDLDSLASPTLAALYASQGHTDVAEKIYSQLGHGESGAAPAVPQEVLAGAAPDPSLLERLVSFREAARRRRAAAGRAR